MAKTERLQRLRMSVGLKLETFWKPERSARKSMNPRQAIASAVGMGPSSCLHFSSEFSSKTFEWQRQANKRLLRSFTKTCFARKHVTISDEQSTLTYDPEKPSRTRLGMWHGGITQWCNDGVIPSKVDSNTVPLRPCRTLDDSTSLKNEEERFLFECYVNWDLSECDGIVIT